MGVHEAGVAMYDDRRTDDRVAGRAGRPVRAGRAVAALCVMVLAVVAFLGYEGDLPRWAYDVGRPTATLLGPPLPPMDPAAVAAAVEPELANINVSIKPAGTSAAGSGIVLTADGQVLTSHHVVKGAQSISVEDIGTGGRYAATVLGYDSEADIALLSLTNAANLAVARIGSSAALRIGDEVLAIGNAGGTGSPTATPGTVTALGSSITARDSADLTSKVLTGMIEVAAPVVSGQSGGALADRYGAVVGVVTAATGDLAKATGRANGYAVPIDTAMRVVRQIRSGMPTDTVHVGPTATLGVITSNAEPAGARIESAVYGLPAYAAGLSAGEVITAIDGRPVATVQTLKAVLNQRKPNDAVHLDLTAADGSQRTAVVVLVAGPPN
ncbi:S1C family serine protease [Nocardia wallacei]|uniref:S1C family serine protease n=1 Tax=Nocardia wallacei TaxID=480035 RepID=UPI0024575DE5|nr:trypsin-like peptidase domain-containing protein [Nocardia wallacei]